ncbi:Paf1 [Ostertagia ostertagi]
MSQPNHKPSGKHKSRGPDFICKPRFRNTLPDVPFPGKFLPCPFVELERFIDYKPTSLEMEYKFEVQCEMDIGLNLDLIDPNTYKVDNSSEIQLNEKDALLLEDEDSNAKQIKRGMQDDDGEQFVAHFIPTVETLQKTLNDKEEGRSFEEGAVYEHTLNREYTWTVKNKNTKGFERDNYFVYYKDGCFHYNELETKVRLARRRRATHEKPNTRLNITYTVPTEVEMQQMTSRMNSLLRNYDSDDEGEGDKASDKSDHEEQPEKEKKKKVESGGSEGSNSEKENSTDNEKDKDGDSDDGDSGSENKKSESEKDSTDESD